MVLLQGAGSCPAHSTAYQPHIQLSMKEGWKDRGIIGEIRLQRAGGWRDVLMDRREGGLLDGRGSGR